MAENKKKPCDDASSSLASLFCRRRRRKSQPPEPLELRGQRSVNGRSRGRDRGPFLFFNGSGEVHGSGLHSRGSANCQVLPSSER